ALISCSSPPSIPSLLLPPPPTPSNAAPSKSGKMSTQSKRPLSVPQSDQLVKTRRLEDTSNSYYEPTEALNDQNIESAVLILRIQRLSEYKQPVYIIPMAKPNLQAPDDTLFPLMEKVKDFLAGDRQ
ncbi:hypothetical protein BG015_006051, partial [Linnemannia schmuckeri]